MMWLLINRCMRIAESYGTSGYLIFSSTYAAKSQFRIKQIGCITLKLYSYYFFSSLFIIIVRPRSCLLRFFYSHLVLPQGPFMNIKLNLTQFLLQLNWFVIENKDF